MMAAAMAIPEHKLSESPNSRTIEIGDWVITATTNPISNATECDALQAALSGMPLPEMTFGNNFLELMHVPSSWCYAFTTNEALRCVKNGELVEGDGGVKVGHSEAWLQSRYVVPPLKHHLEGDLEQDRTILLDAHAQDCSDKAVRLDIHQYIHRA